MKSDFFYEIGMAGMKWMKKVFYILLKFLNIHSRCLFVYKNILSIEFTCTINIYLSN